MVTSRDASPLYGCTWSLPGAGIHPFYQDRYRRDGRFRLELDYCGKHGIPHGYFLGGDLTWTEEDRAKALAWELEQRIICPQCGTYYHEWDPKAGGDIHAYWAVQHVCMGCKAKEDLRASEAGNARESGEKDNFSMHGLQVRLQRNPEASVPPLPMSSRNTTARFTG